MCAVVIIEREHVAAPLCGDVMKLDLVQSRTEC